VLWYLFYHLNNPKHGVYITLALKCLNLESIEVPNDPYGASVCLKRRCQLRLYKVGAMAPCLNFGAMPPVFALNYLAHGAGMHFGS